MAVALAFYKGEGDWLDRTIRAVTRSPFSHVEFILCFDGTTPHQRCWSSSPRQAGVRETYINTTSGNWTIVPVPWCSASTLSIELFFESHNGTSYDVKGILFSQLFSLRRHNKSRWFCSEICATALGLEAPETYSPGSLKFVVEKLNQVHKKAFERGFQEGLCEA